jgi:quercetin dioxygenase-like cupin family protein
MEQQSEPKGTPVVVPACAGTLLGAFGQEVLVKLGGGQTNQTLSVSLDVTPPGGGPPPHYHANDDELFLVQSGRVQFLVEGQWVEPGEGATVYVPRGHVHTYRNAGDTPSRMWVITTPSGFETFFGRCADEFARPGGPDMAKILGISAEHGIHFVQKG